MQTHPIATPRGASDRLRHFDAAVDYDHERNLHTVSGARAALQKFFAGLPPQNVLDIGCGTGTWLRAALDLGVREVCGVEGMPIQESELLVPVRSFKLADLSKSVDLGKKYDLVLCLEVAEHLGADMATQLIQTIVLHSDRVLFSAAAPGQQGQHHVNCQWPVYWQELFNAQGYACNDDFRWKIWEISEIETWYRQNIFEALRAPKIAGTEPRLKSVLHPDMVRQAEKNKNEWVASAESGAEPLLWYISLLRHAFAAKLRRRINL